jgi:phosphoribosylformylglycinamidine (FGAM) synthase PurS component
MYHQVAIGMRRGVVDGRGAFIRRALIQRLVEARQLRLASSVIVSVAKSACAHRRAREMSQSAHDRTE